MWNGVCVQCVCVCGWRRAEPVIESERYLWATPCEQISGYLHSHSRISLWCLDINRCLLSIRTRVANGLFICFFCWNTTPHNVFSIDAHIFYSPDDRSIEVARLCTSSNADMKVYDSILSAVVAAAASVLPRSAIYFMFSTRQSIVMIIRTEMRVSNELPNIHNTIHREYVGLAWKTMNTKHQHHHYPTTTPSAIFLYITFFFSLALFLSIVPCSCYLCLICILFYSFLIDFFHLYFCCCFVLCATHGFFEAHWFFIRVFFSVVELEWGGFNFVCGACGVLLHI